MNENARSRKWSWTLNNYTPEEEAAIQKIDAQYLVYGREHLTEDGKSNGTPHLQGFVYWTNAKTFTAAKARISSRCHLEKAKGNALQNFTYCTKEDPEPFVSGERPLTKEEKGSVEKERWDTIKQDAIAGNLDAVPSKVFVQNYRTLKQIRMDHFESKTVLEQCCGHWIYGGHGTGKSHMARTKYPDAYIKNPSKWWDNYDGEETVIMEDMDPYHKGLGYFLKIWGDKYPYPAQAKGSTMKLIRPKRIIITSQYLPEQCWEDQKLSMQFVIDIL